MYVFVGGGANYKRVQQLSLRKVEELEFDCYGDFGIPTDGDGSKGLNRLYISPSADNDKMISRLKLLPS